MAKTPPLIKAAQPPTTGQYIIIGVKAASIKGGVLATALQGVFRHLTSATLFAMLFVCAPLAALPPPIEFAPAQVLPFAQGAANLSHSPSSNLIFDSAGKLRLVWWSGNLGADAHPSSPSVVYHAQWTQAQGWSAAQAVATSPDTFAARHPSISSDGTGGAWVAWHDYRHCTAAGNYINNVEIYMRRIDANGAPTNESVRVTQTAADHAGDNGYCPKLVRLPDGEQRMVWYDYHANKGASDIYLSAVSPAVAPVDMASSRLTNASIVENAAVDFAVNAAGASALVWTAGTKTYNDLMFMDVGADMAAQSPIVLAQKDVAYHFPPRVCVSPTNGDTVVLWPSQTIDDYPQIKMRHRRGGELLFAPVATIEPATLQKYVDAKFDTDGNLHIVWSTGAAVWYQVRNLETDEKSSPLRLTDGGTWCRATLALDPDGRPYIVAEKEESWDSTSLHFMRPAVPSSVHEWQKWP